MVIPMRYDLLILGGGASGLAAAVTAKSLGIEKIAVIERLPRVGKKILATGNGRCNLSHAGITAKDFRGSVNVAPILDAFGDVRAFFENLGLFTRTDAAGRIYPYSMAASAVLDAFRLRMREDGVEEICGTLCQSLSFQNGTWRLQALRQTKTEESKPVQSTQVDFTASHIIFAAGGYAAPKLGTDGTSWKLLENLHIPLIPAEPNLCPVLSDERLLRPLKGLRVKGQITLLDNGKAVAMQSGEIQFTEKALSGICVFDLSGRIDTRRISQYALVLDPLSEWEGDTDALLYSLQGTRFGMTSEEMLGGLLPKPLVRLILKNAGIAPETVCSDLDGRAMHRLAEALHSLTFPVRGLADFGQAQSTRGGVPGTALDAHLQVKHHPGLYVTGEACDVHADCGGYHLHWAWASGACAATAIARTLRSDQASD